MVQRCTATVLCGTQMYVLYVKCNKMVYVNTWEHRICTHSNAEPIGLPLLSAQNHVHVLPRVNMQVESINVICLAPGVCEIML